MVEAPSGVEPLNRSFADCSLNHLGTAPSDPYYKELFLYCTTEEPNDSSSKKNQ